MFGGVPVGSKRHAVVLRSARCVAQLSRSSSPRARPSSRAVAPRIRRKRRPKQNRHPALPRSPPLRRLKPRRRVRCLRLKRVNRAAARSSVISAMAPSIDPIIAVRAAPARAARFEHRKAGPWPSKARFVVRSDAAPRACSKEAASWGTDGHGAFAGGGRALGAHGAHRARGASLFHSWGRPLGLRARHPSDDDAFGEGPKVTPGRIVPGTPRPVWGTKNRIQ
jgi:hypothetical protein